MGRELIELHDRRIQSSLMGKNAAHPFNLTRREKERKNKRDSRETLHQPRKNRLVKLPGRLANISNAFHVRSSLGIAIARGYKVDKSPFVLAFQPSRCQNQNFSPSWFLEYFWKRYYTPLRTWKKIEYISWLTWFLKVGSERVKFQEKKKKKKKNRFAPHRRTPSFNVQSTESTFGQYTIL